MPGDIEEITITAERVIGGSGGGGLFGFTANVNTNTAGAFADNIATVAELFNAATFIGFNVGGVKIKVAQVRLKIKSLALSPKYWARRTKAPSCNKRFKR